MTMWQPTLSNNDKSIYIKIADEIERGIKQSELTPGERLPTHRALAEQLSVTVGTVTRSYAEAERRGLVTARVGSGTYVNVSSSSNQLASLSLHSTQAMDVGLRASSSGRINFSMNLQIASDCKQMFAEVLEAIARDAEQQMDLLAYQPEQGLPRHRDWAARWLANKNVQTTAKDLTITCGGQHAIVLALLATTRPGDCILSEGLTYPGLNAIARSQLGIKVIGLPMDAEGIIPIALEEQCKQQRVRALYCIPDIQNPTNARMSLARRKAIAEIAEKYRVWIIEDQVGSHFANDDYPPLHQLAPDLCLYINSHSKTVSGGLRVGYLVSPKSITNKVCTAIRAHCWFAPPLTVEVAQRWLATTASKSWIEWQYNEVGIRVKMAKTYLQGFDNYTAPGSFHVWLKLPEPWRATEFQQRLRQQGVELLTAESFAVGRFPAPQAVRISLSSPRTSTEVEQGLEIIRTVLSEEYAVKLDIF